MTRKYDYHKKALGEGYYAGRQGKKKNKFARTIFFLLVIAIAIALFVYVFPEAEVTIVPATEAVTSDFEMTVDTALEKSDPANNKLQGRLIEVEKTLEKEFAATGEKNIGEKAVGQAVFYNQTGLVQPLTVENSLVTDDGVVFFAAEAVEIPKAEVSAEGNIVFGTMTVGVIAEEAGELGNVNPGRLTIIDLPFSKQNKIYAEIQQKPTGGTDKIVQVVSQEDFDQAEESLRDEIYPELRDLIDKEMNDDDEVSDNLISFEVLEKNQAVELDEEIKNFTMAMKAKARAIVWDEGELKDLIKNKIAINQDSGKQLIETSQDVFETEIVEVDFEAGGAKLKVHAVNQITQPIDLEAVKEKIKGKTEFEARRVLLEEVNIKDVRFKFNYSITSKIPENGNRVKVELGL